MQCLPSCGLGMQWNHFWSLQRYGLRRMAASQQVYDEKAKSYSPKRCSELAVTMRHWAGNVCSFPYFIGKNYTYHRSDCYWITLTYFDYLTILTITACISCSYRWKCRSRWIPGHLPHFYHFNGVPYTLASLWLCNINFLDPLITVSSNFSFVRSLRIECCEPRFWTSVSQLLLP